MDYKKNIYGHNNNKSGGDLVDKRVVVENSLKDHIEFLEKSGYEVEKIQKPEDVHKVQSFDYDAVVVSSIDDVPMGATSFRVTTPVVEAKDKTPEEIFNILRGRY